MGFFQSLFGKGKTTVESADLVEAGVCPNCWGKQDYDGKFVQFVEDATKDNVNNNAQNKKAFIQQFVETNISGIKLKREGATQRCPVCAATH